MPSSYVFGDREAGYTRSIDIKHVYEDGDTVITHSLVTRQDPQAEKIAVVHIFWFEADRVAELWASVRKYRRIPRTRTGCSRGAPQAVSCEPRST